VTGVEIAVVIPTHNRRPLLERALASVYAQTRAAQEVIVIDDGSTDDTRERLRRRYPQARYLWQANRGVSSARNRGIRATHYEWIAFLDSDDEWLPYKLERQCHTLAANPGYRICHSDEIWIRHGRRVNPKKEHAKHGGYILQRCLPLCVISPSSVVLHHSLFDEIGMFDERLPACEDYDLWLRICARYPVLFVEQPLIVKHGGHDDQLSRRYPAMDRFRVLALERLVRAGTLSPADQRAALAVLLQKIAIYLAGAAKRGRWQEASRYRQKQAYYSCLAARLQWAAPGQP
jgi:glycosyltransferase involved in cell wall biosynthesis